MGLPDRESASTWGGKLLVDRDGTEIGTCTQIFLDDATGLPEWAQADMSGGPGVIPLVDAAVSGDRVRVAVRRAEVVDAPRVDDPVHISEDEEERLYRHYGITFSRRDSESLLPVAGPAVAEPVVAEPVVDRPVVTEPIVAQSVVTQPVVTQPVVDQPVVPAPSTASTPPATGEVTDVPRRNRRGLLSALAAGTVGVLAAIAAAVFWWRRRQQVPPTRKELLAARARAASLVLASKKDQVATSAAPLVQSGRRLSATAAERAAGQARVAAVQARVAAERARVQARVAAEQARVQARAAAQQAAAVAAARGVRLRRVRAGAELEPQPVENPKRGRQTRRRAGGALPALGGFVAGYALRARAGTGGKARLEQARSSARGQQVQRIAGRVQVGVTDTVRAGNAQLSQRGSAVAGRLRRRSGGTAGVPSASDGSGPSA